MGRTDRTQHKSNYGLARTTAEMVKLQNTPLGKPRKKYLKAQRMKVNLKRQSPASYYTKRASSSHGRGRKKSVRKLK